MSWTDDALAALRAAGRLRTLKAVTPVSATRVVFEGRELVLFSSNDYLGLSQHPDVRAAAARAALERGMGTRGSALICGYTDQHQALEAELAALKGAESALLFPTGFQANLGVLSAIGTEGEIFSDALNHASIIDGCRLARAVVRVYPHNDLDALASLLEASTARRKVIVTDGLFSMDGDVARLQDLVVLKNRHGAHLVVDEAHSTLLYGPTGAGLAEAAGVADQIDFQIGTLSKAIGAQGGFVACSATRRSWLLNVARSYIFSTALPAPVVAAARAALQTASDGVLRAQLWQRVAQLSTALNRSLVSPIVPILLYHEDAAVAASHALLEAGFHVTPIRPPTVPPGTCRLRVALSAAHSPADIDALALALQRFI